MISRRKRDMPAQPDFKKMDEQLQILKKAALALSAMADEFPAVKRNTVRLLSSVKMMELNVSDLVHLTDK
jgi:hypothetical protein